MQSSPSTQLLREPSGRAFLEMRPVRIETQVNRYAEGSAEIAFGHTRVWCTASIEDTLPPWLKAQNKQKGETQGWLTAEYSMLPRATHTRSKRERERTGGRTHEIQRLIGRALRGMVDLSKLGDRTLMVDCDVIQADGGTRTASITGACVAAGIALQKLITSGKCPESVWMDTVSAVSCGIKSGHALVDLDYNEDSSCDVDMNFVITGAGRLIEIQGTAERTAFSKNDLDAMLSGAENAGQFLRTQQLLAWERLGFAPPFIKNR